LAQNLADIEFQAKEFDLQSMAQLIEFKEEVRGKLDISGTFMGSLDQPDISTTVQIEDGYFHDFEFQNLQSKINWKALLNQFIIKQIPYDYTYSKPSKKVLVLGFIFQMF